MNFTPFTGFATGSLPAGTVHQFASAKFAQNLTAGGQVVGVLSGGEGGVHYLRPVDPSGFTVAATASGGAQSQQIITLPITVPNKDGTQQQQTVQIQVVNQNMTQGGNGQEQPKYQIAPISLPFAQGQTTVLAVAYNQQDGGVQLQVQQPQSSQATSQTSDQSSQNTSTASSNLQNLHSSVQVSGIPEGLTVVVPQDLIRCENAEEIDKVDIKPEIMPTTPVALIKRGSSKGQTHQNHDELIATMPAGWQSIAAPSSVVADYLSRLQVPANLPMSLQHFLKFNAETIKREALVETSPLGEIDGNCDGNGQTVQITVAGSESEIIPDVVDDSAVDSAVKPKRKKKYKKKPPKPKKPKPGQVSIVTALDGTTLFCCPQCNMAYPEKELLEQHLIGHKIERRFICDICGAGLKRKEHLERHKLGHNPDRPFICSVCMKGFKRKEHLNLHFVIHSGQKTEVCTECGKAFYRKDHLRKHARSHLARRAKEAAAVPPDPLGSDAPEATHVDVQQVDIQQQSVTQQGVQQIQIQVAQGGQTQIHQIAVAEGPTVVLPAGTDSAVAAMAILQQQQQQEQQQSQQPQTQ